MADPLRALRERWAALRARAAEVREAKAEEKRTRARTSATSGAGPSGEGPSGGVLGPGASGSGASVGASGSGASDPGVDEGTGDHGVGDHGSGEHSAGHGTGHRLGGLHAPKLTLPAIQLPAIPRPAPQPAYDASIELPGPEELAALRARREPAGLEPDIPRGLSVAAGYAWRFLVIAGFGLAVFWLLSYFSAISVPVAIAVLLAALLHPFASLLRRWGWPPALAAVTALLGMIAIIAGVFTAVGAQVARQWPQLVEQTLAGFEGLMLWLASGPLHVDQPRINEWLDLARQWAESSASQLASTAATVGAAFGSFLAGLATALIAAFFFTYHGKSIFASTTNFLIPRQYRADAARAAERGWLSLVSYMRAAMVVAAVDAVGVALVAWLLNVPLVAALFALTFFASFIPVVGAVTAGAVAVLLALVTQGWVSGLIMLAGVIAVQQAESNFLQPFLMGKATNIHPLGVLLGLTAGAVISGILGALLAIPITAFLVAFVRALQHPDEPEVEAPIDEVLGDEPPDSGDSGPDQESPPA